MAQYSSLDNVEVKRTYYTSGALCYEAPFMNGVKHGIVMNCYTSGSPWWVIPYVNGKMHGIEKYHDKDSANIYCLTLYKEDREVAFVKI